MANEALTNTMSEAVSALREEKSHREHFANMLYICAGQQSDSAPESARSLEEHGKRMHVRASELGAIADSLAAEHDNLRFGPLR